MYREPAVWHALLEQARATRSPPTRSRRRARAPTSSSSSTRGRARSRRPTTTSSRAGASARVLGALREAGVPSIHFGTGTATLLRAMAAAGGDVIGLDWRIPLDEGWALVGAAEAVQGNLDPVVLLGPWERVEAAARDVLARAGGRPGHIFNLGHGVLPSTDPDAPAAGSSSSSTRESAAPRGRARPRGQRRTRRSRRRLASVPPGVLPRGARSSAARRRRGRGSRRHERGRP